MATGLSSDLDALKNTLWQSPLILDMKNEGPVRTLRTLIIKRDGPFPLAKNPSLQEELNKIHGIYQEWIQFSITNILNQINIGEEQKSLYQRQFDHATLTEACIVIEQRLRPLLPQQIIYERQIVKYEKQIDLLAHSD